MQCLAFALAWPLLGVSSGTQSGQLTAADVDDNLNFDHYLGYRSRAWSAHFTGQSIDQRFNVDVSDRVVVMVVDEHDQPYSCPVVEVVNAQTEIAAGTSGVLSIFPALDGLPSGPLQLRAKVPGGSCPQDCSSVVTAEGADVSLQLPATTSLPAQMDVAFVLDTTGSMCDELSYLQAEMVDVLGSVQAQHGAAVDTRMGLVLYRDRGDAYVARVTQFGATGSGGPAIQALKAASCGGGGDYPEAMAEAVEAAAQLQWRPGNAARVAFVVADAPPHDDAFRRTLAAAAQLRRQGVKVYGLAASGVGDTAEYLMRLLAVVTGARHLWLTDDSGIGNAHQEPKVLCYQVTRLDQLLVRVLASELTGSRVEALPSQVLREVGQQRNGTCVIDFQPSSTTTMPVTTTLPAFDGEGQGEGAGEDTAAEGPVDGRESGPVGDMSPDSSSAVPSPASRVGAGVLLALLAPHLCRPRA